MAARRQYRNQYIISEAVADLILNQRYPERTDSDYLDCIFHSCARIAYVGRSHSRMNILLAYIKSSAVLPFDEFEANFRLNPEQVEALETAGTLSRHRLPSTKIATFCAIVHLAKLCERNRLSRNGLELRMDDLIPSLVTYLDHYELTKFFNSDECVYLPERIYNGPRVFEPIFVRIKPVPGFGEDDNMAGYLNDGSCDINEPEVCLLPDVDPEFIISLRCEEDRLLALREQDATYVSIVAARGARVSEPTRRESPREDIYLKDKTDISKKILTDKHMETMRKSDDSMACAVCFSNKCNVSIECGHIICSVCVRILKREKWTVKCPHCSRFGLCARLFIV